MAGAGDYWQVLVVIGRCLHGRDRYLHSCKPHQSMVSALKNTSNSRNKVEMHL